MCVSLRKARMIATKQQKPTLAETNMFQQIMNNWLK
jgi:hypothetical protein